MFKVRPSQFTKYISPDKEVPTIEVAKTSTKTREQRLVKGGFTYVAPEKRDKSVLRWVSPAATKTLGLKDTDSSEFAQILAGQKVIEDESQGLYPYAQNYSGHQFGNWAGQLGDGRAISLFELENDGHTYELQLKGAGLTPYSRFADGKAVLRSSIREALASEAVHVLGIPTTRALSLTELPETTTRRETTETCAIVARFAESWVRFGTFELYHSRGDREGLRTLADYCIERFYPESIKNASGSKNRYYEFWRSACLRNAEMIGKCQAYGFLNGVLNTDNTSILGLSIDYGPFAFMDAFSFGFTPNHDDGENRYGFRNAPLMIWWNGVRLGEALGELIGSGESVDEAEFVKVGADTQEKRQRIATLATELIMAVGEEFENTYKTVYIDLMRKRLGLLKAEEADTEEIIEPLLKILDECELDYNTFFRKLANMNFFSGSYPDITPLITKQRGYKPLKSFEQCKADVDSWLTLYIARLEREKSSDDERRKVMKGVNPNFVLRNWVLNEVITSAQKGDWKPFEAVAKMALSPFEDEYSEYPEYLGEVPEEHRNMVCSCSS